MNDLFKVPARPGVGLRLFGSPRIERDGEVLKFAAPPKTLPLLAYLVLNQSQPIGRDALSFAFWPDDSEEDARANLRRHLYRLQQALPRSDVPWILAEGPTVRWNPDAPLWCDAIEFERLIENPETLEDAAALYRGDLVDTVYDDWIETRRERYRARYLDALAQLTLRYRSRRDFDRAEFYAQRTIESDPWREDALRALMAIRYAGGDRSGALEIFDRFAQRLQSEMRIEVMPETIAVRDAILRNAPLPDTPAGAADPVAQSERAPLPFVGRAPELAAAMQLWSRAARGYGATLLVGGEAGIGKSRLVSEVATLALAQGARVFLGTTAFPESRPYQALAEAYRAAVPFLATIDVNPLWLGILAHLVPDLRSARELPPVAALDSASDQPRLFDAFAVCLEAMAQPRPVLLVLEDLHWAGSATTRAVEYLARRVTGKPVLLVVTYREEASPASPVRILRRTLSQEARLEQLSLGRLGSEAVNELVTRLAIDPNEAPRLYAISEGNPLFLESAIARSHAPDATASAGAHGIIDARVLELAPAARAFGEIAATIGQAFNLDVVREVSGWTEAEVLDALGDLLDARIVRESSSLNRFDYVFTHQLIQAALYAVIDPPARRRRHHRVARIMETLYPERLEELAREIAFHYDRAGDQLRAARYYAIAAEAALGVFANETAFEVAQRGLELALDDAGLLFDLLKICERVDDLRGNRKAQERHIDDMLSLADGIAEPAIRCEALIRAVMLKRRLGDREAQGKLVDLLADAAARTGDERWRARALEQRALHLHALGRYKAADEAAWDAFLAFDALDDDRGRVDALSTCAWASSYLGDMDRAGALTERAVAIATAAAQTPMLRAALRGALIVAQVAEDTVALRNVGQRAVDLSRSMGDREGEASALVNLANAAHNEWKVGESLRYFNDAIAIFEETATAYGLMQANVNLSYLLVDVGDVERSRTHIGIARSIAQREDNAYILGLCQLNEGLTEEYCGNAAAAAARARQALELYRGLGHARFEATALQQLGSAERGTGNLDDALEHLLAALDASRRCADRDGETLCLATLLLVRIERSEPVAAQPLAAALAVALANAPDHPHYPRAAWALAQWYRLGRENAAAIWLTRAHERFAARLTALPDDRSRELYSALPFHRQLIAAHDRKEWPPFCAA
ncbi:MAG TPA: AAA family ATPase [Candidatus Baltobacteraceae bacterium]